MEFEAQNEFRKYIFYDMTVFVNKSHKIVPGPGTYSNPE